MTELPIQRSRSCPSQEAHSLQHVDRWVSYRLIGRRKATTASLQQSQMESNFTWKMPACFVKAGLGTAQSSAKSSDLPGKCKCCDRWQRQALCSDFVSKPVSSPPCTLPKQTSGNTTLPQAYPRDNPAAREEKKHISSSGIRAEGPSKNLYRGNIRPPAFTECKKNAGCMDTEGGNNDKCSKIFKLCTGSLSF